MCKREQRRETVFQTSRSLHRIEPPPHPLFLAHSWGSFCELLDLEAWAVDVVCSVSRRKIEEEGSWPIAQKMEKKEVRKKVLSIWKKLRAHGADWDDANERTRGIATGMVNTLLEMEHLTIPSSWQALTQDGAFPELLPRIEGRMWESVHQASEALLEGLTELSSILMRMRKEVAEMEEVVVVGMQVKQQAAAQDASDDGGAEALFLVSQLPVFWRLFAQVADMYQQELQGKSMLAAELPITRDRVTLSAYLSAWTLQVFVDERRLEEVEQQIQAESVLALPA